MFLILTYVDENRMPLVGLVNHLVIIQTVVMCNLTVLKFYHTRSSKVVQQIQSEKQLTVNFQTNFEFKKMTRPKFHPQSVKWFIIGSLNLEKSF